MRCVDWVTVYPSSITLQTGHWYHGAWAEVCPPYADNTDVEWYSNNTYVACVSADNGYIYANNPGTAYIYAEAADGNGAYDRCYVTVTGDILATSVRVRPASMTLTAGFSDYVHAEVCPEDTTNPNVEWYSSDESVATVNVDSGLVVAQGVGTATITARVTDGSDVRGECLLTVNPPIPVTGIEVCPENLTMNVGEEADLCYNICPSDATNQSVIWCSSNENVATVELRTGKVHAHKAGTTTITATTADGCFTVSCAVTVNYCGGSDYRDVTRHALVLQNDGYYVCSTCGYRIKSPELEDKDVLSMDDYLKIVSAMHFYTQCKLLAEENTLTKAYYNLQAENAQLYIDSLRSQEKYSKKYSYVNSSGIYHCNETNDNMLSFVDIADIHLLNIGLYNGLYESIGEGVIAYYCPQIALLTDVLSLVSGQMNALDFGAFVAGMYEDVSENMAKYSKALTIASTLLEMVTSEVSLDDRVVRINLDSHTSAHYIFDKENKIKAARIFYP